MPHASRCCHAAHFDVLCCGGVEHLVDARPVAGAHAHGARLAAGVQHAAAQVRRAQALAGVADGANFPMPAHRHIETVESCVKTDESLKLCVDISLIVE
jgi:hypothetical protein